MPAGSVWTAIGLYCLIGVIVFGIAVLLWKQKGRLGHYWAYPLWVKVVGSGFMIIGWPGVLWRLWQQGQ